MGCNASKDDPNIVNLKSFVQQRVLGEGGFGKVKAVTRKCDKKWYAMKVRTPAHTVYAAVI